MSDDWRVRVELADEDQAGDLTKALSSFDLPHELQTSFRDRVVVSHDGTEVFLYADSREQAEAAERAIGSLASERHWDASTELRRWHPTAEQWEDPDRALPHSESELATEHAELIKAERDESLAQGFPDFEVRVKCASRHAARQLAERLRGEGIRSVQRWQFVVVAADDEDSAAALADRIRSEAPSGSTVTAEASVAEAVIEAPLATPFGPFAVFGGLGG